MATKQAKTIEKKSIVMLELDRLREIRFGHKALKTLGALTGKKLHEIASEGFDLEELEKVLYCGLLSDARKNNETLKLEDMEDLLDEAKSYGDIIKAMNDALELAFEETETQKN